MNAVPRRVWPLSGHGAVLVEGLRQAASMLGILPGRCLYCRQGQADAALGLCRDCAAAFAPRTGGYCSRCGQLYAQEGEEPRLCRSCLVQPPPFSATFFYGAYADALQVVIVQYKYHGRHAAERLLQDLLIQAYTAGHARTGVVHDCIVPIPLHPARLRERGFNQSLELARPLARLWKMPLLAKGLARSRKTAPQAGFGRPERHENVRGAFVAPHPARLAGRRVLLVDDVMTTGATASEAARACLAAGALRVDCCVLARA